MLSRITRSQVNGQNPDHGVTVVDVSLMVGLVAVVVIVVVVVLGVLGALGRA